MADYRLRIGHPTYRHTAEFGSYTLTGRDATLTYGGSAEGPASADVFTADYSTLAGNWDSLVTNGEGVDHNTDLITAGGPGGLNTIRLALIPGGGSDTYWGHRVGVANQTNGVPRYFRWYQKWSSGTNAAFINKLLMLGDLGSATGDRMILQGQVRNFPSVYNPVYQLTFDGLETVVDVPADEDPAFTTIGTWYSVQVAVSWGAGQAYVKIWLNNDTFASPTAQTSLNLSFSNNETGDIFFGAYHNGSFTGGQEFEWEHAAFRAASTFDSNWHGWMVS